MDNQVYIFDTTLRDGEQAPGCSMTVVEKVAMANKLAELHVDILEAGFPIASEGDFEAVCAISREVKTVRIAALARACRGDIERAAKSLESAAYPRIHTFIATSEVHLRHKLRKSQQQVIDDAVAAVMLARSYVDDVEWSAEDATRTDPAYLLEICEAVADAGATTINIPDTVGYAVPHEFQKRIREIVAMLEHRAIVSVHCHDDLGLATANSLAGVEAGARQIECTVNGIGERAGNCSLEEVVMAMRVRHDLLPFETTINTEQIYSASQLLTKLITFGPQPNKAIVGANAFAHEAGIHQDGVLKERTTYEIMDPHDVGVPESRLVLGKHSGRHALKKRCEDLGYMLTAEKLDSLYRCFLARADRKKGVTNEEIVEMLAPLVFEVLEGSGAEASP